MCSQETSSAFGKRNGSSNTAADGLKQLDPAEIAAEEQRIDQAKADLHATGDTGEPGGLREAVSTGYEG
jgi:hypothetical protein